jgi:transketolase
MRALPNMTIVDASDAVETRAAVRAIADVPGPAYLRLKRGEIPLIFDAEHELSLTRVRVLRPGSDVVIVASGMMLAAALTAARTLEEHGLSAGVVNAPVIKPLDADGVVAACRGARAVVTAENHSVVGGLGSAVAEALAEAGIGVPLRRVGVQDRFAESGSRAYLFAKYGLDAATVVRQAWSVLDHPGPAPVPTEIEVPAGTYAPI